MIAVIDTNIFISALLRADSTPRQVLRLCLSGQVTPLMGNALYLEYEEVMSRQSLFKHSAVSAQERSVLFDAFLSRCQWVNIYYRWRPNLKDEADNHVLELAIAGNARWLITGNHKDFQHYQLRFPEIDIVSAAHCVAQLEEL